MTAVEAIALGLNLIRWLWPDETAISLRNNCPQWGAMKAAVRTGGAIRFSAGAKTPRKPGMNEVLVSVRAAGINPIDYKLPKLLGGTVAGLDLAGVAVAVGHGVKDFKEGDEVFGFAKSGSVAEQVSAAAQ